MKKILSILGTVTITSSAIPTVIAAAPYQQEEKILKRNKRWGEVQWIQIAQQWRNAELAYQRAGKDFQSNQNHTAFSQAQQRFLQAQQSFNNSKNEWQQGLTQWVNQLAQERNQQWWNNIKSKQATQSEIQWVTNKTVALALKLGTNDVNKNKIGEIIRKKNNCNSEVSKAAINGAVGGAVGGAITSSPSAVTVGASSAVAGALAGSVIPGIGTIAGAIFGGIVGFFGTIFGGAASGAAVGAISGVAGAAAVEC